jgi:hypothetical protein
MSVNKKETERQVRIGAGDWQLLRQPPRTYYGRLLFLCAPLRDALPPRSAVRVKGFTALVGALLASACTEFQEIHYFQAPGTGGAPPNYYKLTIAGSATFSSAKYVSGYYDEAAVDLLFNELKPTNDSGTQNNPSGQSNAVPALKASAATRGSPSANSSGDPTADQTATAKTTTPTANAPTSLKASSQLTPLDSSKPGSFVMILSTNADAVADTIGNFAESNVSAQAITNLVNRTQLRAAQQSATKQATLKSDANATSSELSGLLGKVPTSSPGSQATTQAYLRVLSAISRALGAGQNFESLEQASTWFSAARLSATQE